MLPIKIKSMHTKMKYEKECSKTLIVLLTLSFSFFFTFSLLSHLLGSFVQVNEFFILFITDFRY